MRPRTSLTSERSISVGRDRLRRSERITHAEAPAVLEYKSGDISVRSELEGRDAGPRLTLWAVIDRRFIPMGAAGWQIAFDALERLLDGSTIGRIAGRAAMQFDGWQRLNAEYAQRFGVAVPAWKPS